jgi:N12 class adenine-specific DNA methylase
MAAAAMELKRLGLAKKSCFVVPNHIVGQWANEFKKLYPTANILAATKKDFEKQNRKRFCARIATGEWDAVIIGHSSFERVPISRERQENRLKRDIKEVASALEEATANDKKSLSVKELQRTLKNLEFELKRLQDSPKDNVVTFEELGIDNLFVDEAHSFNDV